MACLRRAILAPWSFGICRLREALAPGAGMNALESGHVGGGHTPHLSSSGLDLGLETLCWAQGPRGAKAPLLCRGAKSSRLGVTMRGGSKRSVLRRRDLPAGPEEGALPAGGGDAQDLCTWRSFAEPTSQGDAREEMGGWIPASHLETHWPSLRGTQSLLRERHGQCGGRAKELCALCNTPVPQSLPPGSSKKARFSSLRHYDTA